MTTMRQLREAQPNLAEGLILLIRNGHSWKKELNLEYMKSQYEKRKSPFPPLGYIPYE